MKNELKIQHLPTNTQGTDYYIGDIHGCYSETMSILSDIGFDFNKDRLLSVGDIIDRGSESYKCLSLLKEPWFYCVKGNHEQLMVDALLQGDRGSHQCWMANGGNWFLYTTLAQDAEIDKHLLPLNNLPHVIVCDGIALVHADFYGTELTSQEEVLWGRQRHTSKDRNVVTEFSVVVCGHTPVDEVEVLGNVVYIDTGGWYKGGEFTVLSRNEILRRVGL